MQQAWNGGDPSWLDLFVDENIVRRGPAGLDSDAHSLSELKELIRNFRTAYPDGLLTIYEAFFPGD